MSSCGESTSGKHHLIPGETSLAPPLCRAGEGERAEESGDTAIQNLALSTDLDAPIRLLQACGSY